LFQSGGEAGFGQCGNRKIDGRRGLRVVNHAEPRRTQAYLLDLNAFG
jgi:hypothetical protein